MRFLFRCLLLAVAKTLGPERLKRIIPALASYAGVDLLLLAYNGMGILKYQNDIVSGERYVTNVLKKNFESVARPVILDVGANVGKYSNMLLEHFPTAQIYAFEPNPSTFKELTENVSDVVKCVNVGMGSEEKLDKMFTYSDNLSSSHASIYGDVFSTLYNRDDAVEIPLQLTTLDLFCERENLTHIDFLKIDTEGNELNVLKGAERTLKKGGIKAIQFEFGDCDILSRVFLRDFYITLSDYNIYRLDSEKLIPLFEYSAANEIFRYQNFLAIRKDYSFYDAQ